ncbi:MAG: hypothetical protein M1814_002234 [Vezdaea aestivalis]|nr:MAG: hypothetical protein M1814_002234 [Vezdaea aestivalis]
MPTTGQQRLREHHERLLSFYQLGFAIPSSNRTPRTAAAAGSARPRSPKLAPLGSPGPVTPLELEESEDYFSMGAKTTQRRHKQSSSEVASQTSGEVTDREDMKRRELLAVGRPTASDRSSAYH